jgi:hypothetical protein
VALNWARRLKRVLGIEIEHAGVVILNSIVWRARALERKRRAVLRAARREPESGAPMRCKCAAK